MQTIPCHHATREEPPSRKISTFLRATLAEREARLCMLEAQLREVDHRVKNSLQLVAGVLRANARQRRDLPNLSHELDRAATQIQTIAQVHEFLCHTEDVDTVDLGAYLQRLVFELSKLVGHPYGPTVDIHVMSMHVNASRAVAVGLIANELLLNACKYGGWQAGSGQAEPRLARKGVDRLALTVQDDGMGLPGAHRSSAKGT